jgi:hypothetical protein
MGADYGSFTRQRRISRSTLLPLLPAKRPRSRSMQLPTRWRSINILLREIAAAGVVIGIDVGGLAERGEEAQQGEEMADGEHVVGMS